MSRWYKEQGVSQARLDMISYLADMVHNGELQVPPLINITLQAMIIKFSNIFLQHLFFQRTIYLVVRKVINLVWS